MELDTMRALFIEKQKELSLSVAKVDALTRQLDELRGNVNGYTTTTTNYRINAPTCTKSRISPNIYDLSSLNGVLNIDQSRRFNDGSGRVGVGSGNITYDPSITTNSASHYHLLHPSNSNYHDIEKLRQEFMARSQLNGHHSSQVIQRLKHFPLNRWEMNNIDERINELQQRLVKRRLLHQQKTSHLSVDRGNHSPGMKGSCNGSLNGDTSNQLHSSVSSCNTIRSYPQKSIPQTQTQRQPNLPEQQPKPQLSLVQLRQKQLQQAIMQHQNKKPYSYQNHPTQPPQPLHHLQNLHHSDQSQKQCASVEAESLNEPQKTVNCVNIDLMRHSLRPQTLPYRTESEGDGMPPEQCANGIYSSYQNSPKNGAIAHSEPNRTSESKIYENSNNIINSNRKNLHDNPFSSTTGHSFEEVQHTRDRSCDSEASQETSIKNSQNNQHIKDQKHLTPEASSVLSQRGDNQTPNNLLDQPESGFDRSECESFNTPNGYNIIDSIRGTPRMIGQTRDVKSSEEMPNYSNVSRHNYNAYDRFVSQTIHNHQNRDSYQQRSLETSLPSSHRQPRLPLPTSRLTNFSPSSSSISSLSLSSPSSVDALPQTINLKKGYRGETGGPEEKITPEDGHPLTNNSLRSSSLQPVVSSHEETFATKKSSSPSRYSQSSKDHEKSESRTSHGASHETHNHQDNNVPHAVNNVEKASINENLESMDDERSKEIVECVRYSSHKLKEESSDKSSSSDQNEDEVDDTSNRMLIRYDSSEDAKRSKNTLDDVWYRVKRRPMNSDCDIEKELSRAKGLKEEKANINSDECSSEGIIYTPNGSKISHQGSNHHQMESTDSQSFSAGGNNRTTSHIARFESESSFESSDEDCKMKLVTSTSSLSKDNNDSKTKSSLKSEQSKGHERLKRKVSFDPMALLLDAALEGELDLIKKTASQIPDVSAASDDGVTALHNTICAGHLDVVKYLVEIGGDVNSPDSDGWTPLHCAASCNKLSMVKYLIENGACIFATTFSDRETPAQKCEEGEEGYSECYEYLIEMQENFGVMNDGIVYGVYDYEAQKSDELSFKRGDKIKILRRGDDEEHDWWWASLNGREGYVPRNLLGLFPRAKINKKMD
ncbi:uncharacterized protein LOC141858019 [Brevipalpus obovatus]|uniref:uncharacterized protein LOC141858019 n=1 Tax=Brevipalpus obovatus TaxID=246614 RepID=UPI003D9EB657